MLGGYSNIFLFELGRIFIKNTKIFRQEPIDIVVEVEAFSSRNQTIMEHMYLSQITTR